MRVLFYGQFIPLHGIETIVRAAALLRHEPIDWHLIGRGQEAAHIRAMLDADPLPGVRWTEWTPYGELITQLQSADLCLGIFGTSDKAASVIPNKVFQIVAAGRPLMTRDSPAIRELLAPLHGCVYLVQAGDPQALAEAIRLHLRDFHAGTGIAGNCHPDKSEAIAPRSIAQQFLALFQRVPEYE
jgi:glycosyltransferase involved in cell wall biosynthesis